MGSIESRSSDNLNAPAAQARRYAVQSVMRASTDSAVYLARLVTHGPDSPDTGPHAIASSDWKTSSEDVGDVSPRPPLPRVETTADLAQSTQFVVLKVGVSPTGELAIRHEANLLAHCQHPHLVAYLDAGTTERVSFQPLYEPSRDVSTASMSYFLAIPHLQGGDLGQRLQQAPPLAPLDCVRIGRDIASAAAYLHATGIVHRDIKPANILLDGEGHAVLCDLGIACRLDPLGTPIQAGLGTPSYMPPEQWRGDALGAGTDIYALGVVVYQMLTGHLPFPEADADTLAQAHLTRALPSPHLTHGRRITPDLGAILLKALRKSIRERFQLAGEFERALELTENDLRRLTLPGRYTDRTGRSPNTRSEPSDFIGYICPQCSRSRPQQWAVCPSCGWPERIVVSHRAISPTSPPASPSPVSMCLRCGAPQRRGATVCLLCGAAMGRNMRPRTRDPLGLRCWHCGHENPGDKIICLACGSPLY